MAFKRVTVKNETPSGRNSSFRDNVNKQNLSRNQFVKQIESGNYDNYHVRVINGVKTPCSNPDRSTHNNLD